MIESISVCFKCLETNFVFIVHTCEIMIILTYFFFLDVIIADCCWWCCCCCFICTSYRIIKQCNREQRIAHNCYYRTEKKNTPQRRQRKWNVKRLVYTSIGSLVRTCTFIYIYDEHFVFMYMLIERETGDERETVRLRMRWNESNLKILHTRHTKFNL